MKRLIYVLLLTFLATGCNAKDDVFNIEEGDLHPISKAVDFAIRNTESLEGNCKFLGKVIDLSGQGKSTDFIVTTAEACDWGASAGPIWVLRGNKVVLSTSSSILSLEPNRNNGLQDIRTSHASAGVASIEFWSLTGRQYKKIKSYDFTPDDMESCKAHKDICPYK